jgi:hypothetical protein
MAIRVDRTNPRVITPTRGTAGSGVDTSTIEAEVIPADGGYEFTGGFANRRDGQAGASDVGTSVEYTSQMVRDNQWLRFGFATSANLANDSAYWVDPTPAPTSGVGLFGGSYMPAGVTQMIDFDFYDPAFSDLSSLADGQLMTPASGSLDFSECRAGDLALVRFDFNAIVQTANTTLEIALIWATRDANDNITYSFTLTTQPIFFGQGTVGNTYLNRPIISAYFASNEDVNARALLAVKADQPIFIQPLTTLVTIVR